MTSSKFDFPVLVKLLRRSENDAEIRSFFGQAMSNMTRSEYYGLLNFKPEGVDAVFSEAPWVLPAEEITDPKELFLSAFHLHSEGHEGFVGYTGQLPEGLKIADSAADVIQRLGQPATSGGGGFNTLLQRTIPHWIRYPFGDITLHFQFDANDQIDLVTIAVPDPE